MELNVNMSKLQLLAILVFLKYFLILKKSEKKLKMVEV